MPRNSTVYEVLIASPGDVISQRKVVAEVLEDWNAAHAKATGRILQARRWELDSFPELGERPQAIINKRIVDEADLLIAVFSARLGSATGVSPSGTVEEIERFRAMEKPVMVYFSKAPIPREHDPEQLSLLKEYKRDLGAKGLYWDFVSDDDLRRQVTRHLAAALYAHRIPEQHQETPKKPPLARIILSPVASGRSGDVRTVTLSAILENLSPVKRITEYMVTLSVPSACMTHSSTSYVGEIRGENPGRRFFQRTEADENVILPGKSPH